MTRRSTPLAAAAVLLTGALLLGACGDGQPPTAEGARTTVVTEGRAAAPVDLQQLARLGDDAVEQVDRIWPRDWPRRLVVVVPGTPQDLMGVLDRPPAGLDALAAVTTGHLPADGEGSPRGDRVVLNPATFPALDERGQRIALTHEAVHVALRASLPREHGGLPAWLSEGFADYVAYRDSGVPWEVAAADVLAAVRTGTGPVALPTRQELAGGTDLPRHYAAAWTACVLLAEQHGEAALVAAVEAAAERGAADAFAALGTTEAAFTRSWLAHLRSRAVA